MAGSDTGLPGGSRGNGGWRPLKRDRSRPADLAELDRGGGRTAGRACLSVSEACRSPHSIALGSALDGRPPGSARLGRVGSGAPSPSPGDLHAGSAQRPLPNQEYRPRAGPPGRIDPSKAPDLKMSNLPFPGGRRGWGGGAGGGRLRGWGRTAGHRPGACALNEKRPGLGHPRVAVASRWGQERSPAPFPIPMDLTIALAHPQTERPQRNKDIPQNVGRQIWRRSLNMDTRRGTETKI